MATDFQTQKTDDQLRFLLHNPALYHADLVQAARQELLRRGAPLALPAPAPAAAAATEAAAPPAAAPPAAAPPAATPAASAAATSPAAAASAPTNPPPPQPTSPPTHQAPAWQPITYQSPPEPERGAGRPYLGLGLLAALLLLAGGLYWRTQTTAPPPAVTVRRPPPRLVDVATVPLPNSETNVARCVRQQTARLPAAERTEGPALRQYRELTRRFWAAQTLTEYLAEAARTRTTSPAFDEQVLLAHAAWREWAKARVYSYRFGPAMADHLDRMTRAAQQQTQLLADLPADVAAARAAAANGTPPPPADPNDAQRAAQRAADVADLLRDLLPTSPVTGRPYPASVRRVKIGNG